MNALGSLLFAAVLLAIYFVVFVWFTRRVRRGGGGMTSGVLGATHEMLSEERRRAGEMILKRNAGDQLEEDEDGDPPKPSDARKSRVG